jgi:hypothetical protein
MARSAPEAHFPRIMYRDCLKSLRDGDSVVPRETNTLLFRAISIPYTGQQITVEMLLKSLFR